MKCHNCGNNAMYLCGSEGQQVPLCLDCTAKLRAIQASQIQDNERLFNLLSDQMDSVLGLPGVGPRFPERRVVHIQGPTLNNIQISESQIGLVNTGTIRDLDNSITVMKQSGSPDLGKAITLLSDIVLRSNELNGDLRKEVVELLSVVASEVNVPKEKRRDSAVRTVIKRLGEILNPVGSLAAVWQAVEPLFRPLFSH